MYWVQAWNSCKGAHGRQLRGFAGCVVVVIQGSGAVSESEAAGCRSYYVWREGIGRLGQG